MKPTIKDVAKAANVSIATVSRILNNLPGYSEETKTKVMNVIEEMGYQPNAIARGLINKRTQTIGVLFPDVSSMFSSKLLNGIEYTANRLNHSVIVCNTDSNGKRIMKYLQVLREKQVDGIIFVSGALQEEPYRALMAMQIPVVLVATLPHPYDLPYIKVDDSKAAYSATTFLIEKGHRHIGMIAGTKDDMIAGRPRVEGYMQALTDYDIPVREPYIVYGDFGYRSGLSGMEQLWEQAPNITAVFAASDEMAVGALLAAHKHGVHVPDELSVIGYDNTQIAEMAIPPLTTVSQPLHEMGKEAAQMLLTMMEDPSRAKNLIMPYTVVERETVKDIT
ncbi:LacI family DNA-binding transcriptional regulator [Aneurinibacillus terranovensis]|uniref:LacI family DNA-binding transcriptional regulator n=1 Tax=Aneurinibacillus terranovensis TaxID=278991 RepID=UPI0004073128|nr:LacI family DNA-binding transcriptional regulator [Aneurinibacillus terranovensis]